MRTLKDTPRATVRIAVAASCVMLLASACTGGPTSYQRSFTTELKAQYGGDTRVGHSFFIDSLQLQLLIDGAEFRRLPDSAVVERARQVADLAMAHWDPRLRSERLIIRFVRFLPRAGASFCAARSVTFTIDLTALDRPSGLQLDQVDFSRAPCP